MFSNLCRSRSASTLVETTLDLAKTESHVIDIVPHAPPISVETTLMCFESVRNLPNAAEIVIVCPGGQNHRNDPDRSDHSIGANTYLRAVPS